MKRDIYWHIPLPFVKSDDIDDKIARTFFVTMGIIGVTLVALTAKIAATKGG